MARTRTSYPCLTTVHLSFRPIIRAEATDQLLFTLVAIVVINLIRSPATEQGEKRAKRAANSCKPGPQIHPYFFATIKLQRDLDPPIR